MGIMASLMSAVAKVRGKAMKRGQRKVSVKKRFGKVKRRAVTFVL